MIALSIHIAETSTRRGLTGYRHAAALRLCHNCSYCQACTPHSWHHQLQVTTIHARTARTIPVQHHTAHQGKAQHSITHRHTQCIAVLSAQHCIGQYSLCMVLAAYYMHQTCTSWQIFHQVDQHDIRLPHMLKLCGAVCSVWCDVLVVLTCKATMHGGHEPFHAFKTCADRDTHRHGLCERCTPLFWRRLLTCQSAPA